MSKTSCICLKHGFHRAQRFELCPYLGSLVLLGPATEAGHVAPLGVHPVHLVGDHPQVADIPPQESEHLAEVVGTLHK